MRTAKNPSTGACRHRRGASAVELAVILPLLMTIVLGTVDFGRFAYNYIAVANAARAGASYAIMNNYSASSLAAWRTAVKEAARDEMKLQTGYSASNLTVSDPVVTKDPPPSNLRRVRVTASYTFTTLVNWNWPLLSIPNSISMTRQVEMRMIR